jgi:hypothetical protein
MKNEEKDKEEELNQLLNESIGHVLLFCKHY